MNNGHIYEHEARTNARLDALECEGAETKRRLSAIERLVLERQWPGLDHVPAGTPGGDGDIFAGVYPVHGTPQPRTASVTCGDGDSEYCWHEVRHD